MAHDRSDRKHGYITRYQSFIDKDVLALLLAEVIAAYRPRVPRTILLRNARPNRRHSHAIDPRALAVLPVV
jgi:hypothetical protein